MSRPWSEVQNDPKFQQLEPEKQAAARRQYFDEVVAPKIEGSGRRRAAWDQFSNWQPEPAPAEEKPGLISRVTGAVKSGLQSLGDTRQRLQDQTNADLAEKQTEEKSGLQSLGEALARETHQRLQPGPLFNNNKKPDSVMAALPEQPRSGPPVTLQAQDAVQSLYDREPERRAELLARQDWVGQIARQIDGGYQKLDQAAHSTPIDSRRESIARRARSAGADTDTAESMATGGDTRLPSTIGERPESLVDQQARRTAEITGADWAGEIVRTAVDRGIDVGKVAGTVAKMGLDVGQMIPLVGYVAGIGSDAMADMVEHLSGMQSGKLQDQGLQLAEVLRTGTPAQVMQLLLNNPGLLSSVAIPSAGSVFLIGGTGFAIGKIQAARYAGRVSPKALARIQQRAATEGAIWTNAVVNAGAAYDETEGGPLAKYTAALIAGAGSRAVGGITKGGAEGTIARGGEAVARHPLRTIGKVTGREIVQEFGEGASEALGVQTGDIIEGNRDNYDLRQVANLATLEAAAAGPIGAAIGGVSAIPPGAAPPRELPEEIDATRWDPRSIDAAARASLDPNNAQLRLVEEGNAVTEVDATGDPGSSSVDAGSTGDPSAVRGVGPGGSTDAGAPVAGAPESASVGGPDAEPTTALTPETEAAAALQTAAATGDPVELAITRLEVRAAQATGGAPQPISSVQMNLSIGDEVAPAPTVPAVQPRPDGTVRVIADAGTVQNVLAQLGEPPAVVARTADGATLVGARQAETVQAALKLAYPDTELTRQDLTNVFRIGQADLGSGFNSADVRLVSPSSLWARTPVDGEQARVDGPAAAFMGAVAEAAGMRLVFFESPTGRVTTGGAIIDGDGSTSYLNVAGPINPVTEAVHEVTHLLKQRDPAAYAAYEQALTTVTQGQPILDTSDTALLEWANTDYLSVRSGGLPYASLADVESRTGLTRAQLVEEMVADATGVATEQPGFWPKVFREMARTDKSALKKLVQLFRDITQQVRAILGTGGSFVGIRKYINDMDGLVDQASRYLVTAGRTGPAPQQTQGTGRAIMSGQRPATLVGPLSSRTTAETTAQYNTARGVPSRVIEQEGQFYVEPTGQQPQLAAPDTGARGDPDAQSVRDGDAAPAEGVVPEYGQARDSAVRVVATHYSKEPRGRLSGSFYGTGLKGAEAERLRTADPELRHRIYFYVDTGQGVFPEAGVGSQAHEVSLANVYDGAGDPLDLKHPDLNTFEKRVIDAGFDGYLNRNFDARQGAVVLLGSRHSSVPVSQSGQGARPTRGQKLAEPQRSPTGQVIDKLLKLPGVPGGQVSAERWGDIILGLDPELHQTMDKMGLFEGSEPVYRSELAGRMRKDAESEPRVVRSGSRPEEKLSDHQLDIVREDRLLAERTRLSADEKKQIKADAKKFGFTAKELEREVRRIKSRFPIEAGWVPITFDKIDANTLKKKATADTPMPVDALFFKKIAYGFHQDKAGKADPKTEGDRIKLLAQGLAGEILGKYTAAQSGDPVGQTIMRQAGWYRELRTKLRWVFGGFADYFAQLLGPTSSNNPVEPNFRYASEAITLSTSGAWDHLIQDTLAWRADIQAAAANLDAVEASLTPEQRKEANGLVEEVKAKFGAGNQSPARAEYAESRLREISLKLADARDALRDAAVYKGVEPRRDNGKRFGMATNGILEILADVWGDKKPGDSPKTKNYYQNIIGRTIEATIDVWAARTLRRLSNELVGTFPRIPGPAEKGVAGKILVTGVDAAGSEFGFGQSVFREAAAELRASGIAAFKDVTPSEIQAMIWFAEKELWARRDWTTKIGEGGSIEHELLLAGYPNRDQLSTWRVSARAGKPKLKLDGLNEAQQARARVRWERDVGRWEEAKAVAEQALNDYAKYPDRFVAGVTGEIPGDTPIDREMAALGREVESAALATPGVVAVRAQSSVGVFMADRERTIDFELTARNQYDATPLARALREIGNREGQQATFLSRVLRPDEVGDVDTLRHRPGLELYFSERISPTQAEEIVQVVQDAGFVGMTLATEGRRTPDALAGATQDVVGIRVQFIPEFNVGDWSGSYSAGMSEAEIQGVVAEAKESLEDLAETLRTMGNISTAEMLWYETEVSFYGDTTGASQGVNGASQGQIWSGRTIAEGLASADRFNREHRSDALESRRNRIREERAVLRAGGGPAVRQSPRRLGFYSQLERAVEQVPARLETQPAAQWKAWLNSNAGKLGIKKDEIQWSGVTDWLDLQGKRKVTKDEIGAFLDQGGVRVEEVQYGAKPLSDADFESWQAARDAAVEDAGIDGWVATMEGEPLGPPEPRRERAEQQLREEAYREIYGEDMNGISTKYASYVVPGGENYREVLLTLPSRESPEMRYQVLGAYPEDGFKTREEAQNYIDTILTNMRDPHLAEVARIMQRELDKYPFQIHEYESENSASRKFRASHWGEDNVLAHVRLDDRTGPSGEQILFVQEIQSDWGQQGRSEGFGRESLSDARLRALIEENDTNADTEGLTRAQLLELAAASGVTGGSIAPAPFVTDTKAWAALALKRAIVMAAEGGYDQVAIINGQQAANLYDLSKHVGAVGYMARGDNFNVTVWAPDSEGSSTVWRRESATAQEVENTLGKEIAQKMLDGVGQKEGEVLYLKDLDLKVGGEGMRAFYDQIVPQVANDVLKKLGGGKVGAVEIRYDEEYTPTYPMNSTATRTVTNSQIAITITPAMREKVQTEGVPLFSPRRVSETKAAELEAGEKVTLYRAMSLVDGKLYPPMSAKMTDASGRLALRDSEPIGEWQQSEERADLVPTDGPNKGKFPLKKPGGGTTWALYAPYFHASPSPLNDQFTAAYLNDGINRPQLVTVEVEAPASELSSGYKAEGSVKTVGLNRWNSGVVASKVPGGREVILSRYLKIKRIVPDAEVAEKIASIVNPNRLQIPENVVTPQLRAELEKRGVRIAKTGTRGADIRFSPRRPQTETVEFKRWFGDSKVVDEKGQPLVVYHGTASDITAFRATRTGEFGPAIYTTADPNEAVQYGVGAGSRALSQAPVNVMPVYVRLQNPFMGGVESFWKEFNREGDTDAGAVQRAKDAGYDGVIATRLDWRDKVLTHYIAFEPTQIKSATGNDGNFDGANPDIRHSPRRPQTQILDLLQMGRVSQTQVTDAPPTETSLRAFQRVWQDKLNRFTVIQDWLTDQGITLTEAANVYRAEERMHGRSATQMEDFREKRVRPIVERITKAGFTLAEVADFLHAQHAPERNKQIAKINKAMPDGGSGMTNAEAATKLAAYAQKPELMKLANELRRITNDTRAILLREGLITTEMSDAWTATYKHYVPLRGGPDTDAAVQGTGKGLTVKAKQKRALGHGERAEGEFIIENILSGHERAILLAEKNRVGQHLLKLAIEAGHPDLIVIDKPVKRQVLRDQKSYAVEYHGSTVQAFRSLADAQRWVGQEVLKPGRKPGDFQIRESHDLDVALMPSPMLDPNETQVYVNGHAIRVQFKDELLARAWNNMGAEHMNVVFRVARGVNTWLSKAYTGYNPEFLGVNVVRDLSTGVANMVGEEGAVFAARALARYPKSFAELLRYAFTRNASNSIAAYRADGGTTGAAYLSDLERIGRDINNSYDKYAGVVEGLRSGGPIKAARVAGYKVADGLIGWIEKLNQAGENAMRLAVYRAAVEGGKTRAQGAALAKNSTVNFNRKGEVGQIASALYLFFNPAVQGSASIAHALFKGKHKHQAQALVAGMVGLGYWVAASMGGGPEDEWEKISEFSKERFLHIWKGDGWVKIPIPYGYGFFVTLGRQIQSIESGGDPTKASLRIAESLVGEFTIWGGVADPEGDERNLLFLAPTLVQLPGAVLVNRTGLGSPIYPEAKFDESKPDNQKMWRATQGTAWATTAKALNAITGGNVVEKGWLDVSPETLKYIWRTATGGAGKFFTDSAQLAWNLSVEGLPASDIETREVPLVRKFVADKNDIRGSRSRFWEHATEVREAIESFRRAKNLVDTDIRRSEMRRVHEEQRERLALSKVTDRYIKLVAAKRDRIQAVMADDTKTLAHRRAAVRVLEREEAKIYDQYVALFRSKTE